MKDIKWGVFATGGIASTFAKALNATDGAIAYAVASRTQEKADAFAKEHGFQKAFGTYEELAKCPDVDVVYIASPMSSHYKDVLLCFEHGKNVLCEKAVTVNAKQLEHILQVAKEKDLFFMEAMWMKCQPTFKKAVEWIKNGKIGNVKYVKTDFCFSNKYDDQNRLYKKSLGGGAMLDLGVYTTTFATAFLGDNPNQIFASGFIGRTDVDYDSTVILNYDNASAGLSCGFSVENQHTAFIIGDKGRIAFPEWFFMSQHIELYDENNEFVEAFDAAFDCNGYEYEILEVQKCLNEGLKDSPVVPQSSTLAVMKILDEARKQLGVVYDED